MSNSSLQQTDASKFPFVLINMAMTADGAIATGNRMVSSFSSQRDSDHLFELRATADAVMCGARTVDSDDIDLGPGVERYRRMRRSRGLAADNLRIIVSGSGTVDPESAIFKHRFSPIIVLTTYRASESRLRVLRSLADEVRICGTSRIDFSGTLRWLKSKWGVRRLLCEGGGELNAALFRAGLVHELNLTICPTVFGGRRSPTIADGAVAPRLSEATRLTLRSQTRQGDELFLVYDVSDSRVSTQRASSQRRSLRRFR
jgi:2,5-diamino-6-(ribosylamino)-4(3H)-pyrimidinone 5'-phosphate reductase